MRQRIDWVDLARGLAVVSMIVAHTSPWGGVLNLSEHLTTSLFAMLMGYALLLTSQNRDLRTFLITVAWRGVVLIVIGFQLQRTYGQIVVVLQWLGALTLVAGPVIWGLRRHPRALLLGAAISWLLSPLVMDWSRHLSLPTGPAATAVNILAASPYYRVTTLLVYALAGAALASWWSAPTARRVPTRLLFAWTGLLGAGAAGSYLFGRLVAFGGKPHTGTWPEILGAALLSVSALLGCRAVAALLGPARTRRYLGAVIDTGTMALTAYSLQILALALVMSTVYRGKRDDRPEIMFGLIALCVGVPWLWRRRFRVGPLEWVLRLIPPASKRTVSA